MTVYSERDFFRQPGGRRPGRCQRVGGVVLELDRGAEDGERRVTDELVDQAVVPVDLLDDRAEEAVEHPDHRRGLVLGSQGGGADHVDEQHRDHAGLTTELDMAEGRRLGHVLADVAAEHVPQVLAVAEAADHLVEPGLELATRGPRWPAPAGCRAPATDSG